MTSLTFNNPPKAMIVLTALICVTVLIAFGKVDAGAGMSVIGLIVGYGIGNGIAAKQGEPVEPIIGTSRRDRRDEDSNSTEETVRALEARLDVLTDRLLADRGHTPRPDTGDNPTPPATP